MSRSAMQLKPEERRPSMTEFLAFSFGLTLTTCMPILLIIGPGPARWIAAPCLLLGLALIGHAIFSPKSGWKNLPDLF